MTSFFNKDAFLKSIASTATLNELEKIRIEILGKKGALTSALKSLSNLSIEEKKERGQSLNRVKTEFVTALELQKNLLENKALEEKLLKEKIDVTRPLTNQHEGRLHPLSQTIHEVVSIFGQMGFKVAAGPEIEKDAYNFDMLNIAPEHPARQEHDTFYVPPSETGEKYVLRTQTSPVQIRTLLNEKAPVQIIVPGRTFRSDYDQTHTPVFHQVEGLFVAKDIHMGHLKGCLEKFLQTFFDCPGLKLRFRPSHFPFTEPSAEVDVQYAREKNQLKIGQGDEWLEILGCGMVHPQVLKNCGLDPETVQGFAFGMGLERIAMLKYGLPDLRAFYENDLDWINHYGFKAYETPSLLNGLARGI